MASARPLHELFTDLTGEPAATYGDAAPFGEAPGDGAAELLRLHGHTDLPDALVAEAMVNYAETASPEVAEHLAPFVMAHTGFVTTEPAQPGDWLDLLATAPAPGADDPDAGDPAAALDLDDPSGTLDAGMSHANTAADGATETPGMDVALDFGSAANEPARSAAADEDLTGIAPAPEPEPEPEPSSPLGSPATEWLDDIDSTDIDVNHTDPGAGLDGDGDGDALAL